MKVCSTMLRYLLHYREEGKRGKSGDEAEVVAAKTEIDLHLFRLSFTLLPTACTFCPSLLRAFIAFIAFIAFAWN